ncbi:MAG: hypothetical protein L0191_09225 [Acidobacteria bacterium]|nr:hypothetical protein [Acidobacteriota bacterium]
MARKRENQEHLDRAVRFLEDCRQHHYDVMRQVDKRYLTYRGIVERRSDENDPAQWQSQLYGKYAMHIVDSTLASMVEDRLRYKIRPRPTLEDIQDPAAMNRLELGSEAHQILFDWQNRQSKFTRVQKPFLLQNAIAGITVAKTYWVEKMERRRRMVAVDEELLDENGLPIFDPATGQVVTTPQLREESRAVTVYDGPMTEVVDVHDFFWAENARTMSGSRYVAHRVRMSRDELEKEFEPGGMYGPDNGGWTWRQVQADIGTSRDFRDEYGSRWGEKEATHDKDNLEIFEVYDNFTHQVIAMVNRRSLIGFRDKFPFFHERPPFTVCTTQADLFQIVGVAQIEKVQALQEMLWNIQNQSLDSLRLINNAIIMYRPDLEDPDALEWSPGAMWPVESPDQVVPYAPNPLPAEISLNREALIKGDMQNLASTFPFSSGAESQTVDQKTATGASIVSALAQRSIDMSKQPVYAAWEDIGNDRVILNNQFIREPTAAFVLGFDGKEVPEIIYPELLAGDYSFEIEPLPDALIKQQEEAKAQGLVQVIGQIAPILLPLAQAGAASMINFDAVLEFYLKSLGIEDTKQFFLSKAPAAQIPGPGGQGAQPSGEENLGITAGPAGQQPGSQMADSPVKNLQRAQALGGGGRSV